MQLFHPGNRNRTARNRRIYALYELWYTVVDVGAAASFLIGSVLFFEESTQTVATWFFLVGSVLFMLKPTIRLMREFAYFRDGELETLAEREERM